ncbi:MAG: FKBP-type peptidyl-prolyl cis-trans isomerase [Bacillota bacterium]
MRIFAAAALAWLLAACAGNPLAKLTASSANVPPAVASPVPDAATAQALAQPADATVLPSGLAYKILKPGTGGEYPGPTDGITVNYTLWRPDGAELESTCDAAGNCKPASFTPLVGLIKGWQQAISLMTPGEKMRIWVPADLAYGKSSDRPDHPPLGDLIFDVELVSVDHS